MRFIITGKNIAIDEDLISNTETKLSELSRYLDSDTELHITLSKEKDGCRATVTIPYKGSIIRSEQISNDFYVSVDLVKDSLEKGIMKNTNLIRKTPEK